MKVRIRSATSGKWGKPREVTELELEIDGRRWIVGPRYSQGQVGPDVRLSLFPLASSSACAERRMCGGAGR